MFEDLARRALQVPRDAEIESLGEGMDSVALLVGGIVVCRIGKTPEILPAFEREAALLPILQPLTDLELPDFQYVGTDDEAGLPYVGYPLIEGAELTPTLFRAMDDEVRDRITRQVAGFLQAVNGIDISVAKSCGIKEVDFDAVFQDLLGRAQYRLYPQMGVDGQGYIDEIFDRFLNRNPDLDGPPVLLHADLSAEHMILNDDQTALKGIVDFGDLCIGDPDYEYHWLMDEFGRDFGVPLAEKMGVQTHRQFYDKQKAFLVANVLEDVLLMEKADYNAYRRALQSINRGDFSGVYES